LAEKTEKVGDKTQFFLPHCGVKCHWTRAICVT